MTAQAAKETLAFQTEVSQLLNLMINSLYSNKEIFLRELISNASDAADKLKFEALANDKLYEGDPSLQIRVEFDKKARTISIIDNGIGMSHDEAVEHLGTIAKSGTRSFLESLTGDQAKDAQLIGQFGVGFYSAFIVADKVTVKTRRAGLSPDQAVMWESEGKGEFTIEPITQENRGTEVILHLKKEEKEFLDRWRLRSIITKYSDHISIPIVMKTEPMPAEEGKEPEAPQDETVNRASALWTRPKREIKSEEYEEFYKHVSHDFEPPLAYSHNQVEGKLNYTSLLYIPKRAPFDLWDREHKHGVRLYVRRVFIMDDAESLMPRYLRFVKGVIDSDDLPLNISREILQQNAVVDKIRTAAVKKILGLLEKMAEKEPEKYSEFWKTFGRVLKEGPGEDFTNREQIAKLLRFSSTHTGGEEQTVSLDDYLSRMKEGQNKIYYIATDSFASAKNSPHLEVFRKKGIEVLLMWDPVDQWLSSHLNEYAGKSFQSIAKGELDLGELEDEAEKQEQEKVADENKDLVEKIKDVLSEKVKEVRVTHRLTESPACLVVGEYDMAVPLQRLLKNSGHGFPQGKPILEINPLHHLVERMKSEADTDKFSDLANVLFDQALLVEGGQLDDPAAYVSRINALLNQK
jgi:molecular chaperone HtpG